MWGEQFSLFTFDDEFSWSYANFSTHKFYVHSERKRRTPDATLWCPACGMWVEVCLEFYFIQPSRCLWSNSFQLGTLWEKERIKRRKGIICWGSFCFCFCFCFLFVAQMLVSWHKMWQFLREWNVQEVDDIFQQSMSKFQGVNHQLPRGLVVRIPGFHSGGPCSNPGVGTWRSFAELCFSTILPWNHRHLILVCLMRIKLVQIKNLLVVWERKEAEMAEQMRKLIRKTIHWKMFSVPIVKVVSWPTLAHCLVVGIAGFQTGGPGSIPGVGM